MAKSFLGCFLPAVLVLNVNNILPSSSASSCDVDTSIQTFPEDVRPGTIVLKIPYVPEESWEFWEDRPLGYLKMISANKTKVLVFSASPDLEDINDNRIQDESVRSLEYTLSCTYRGIRHTYEQRIAILDVNDFDPDFVDTPFHVHVNEMATPGTTIFRLADKARDDDVTGRIAAFRIHKYNDRQIDGSNKFSVSARGRDIVLTGPLDYDAARQAGYTNYFLNISALDNGFPTTRESFTTLNISVTDADDQGPAFVYSGCPLVDRFCATPAYLSFLNDTSQGVLQIYPASIQAEDRDSLKYDIHYSIVHADPSNLYSCFEIDAKSGFINQTRQICNKEIPVGEIRLIIKAEEVSANRRALTATLIVAHTSRDNQTAAIFDPQNQLSTEVLGAVSPPISGLVTSWANGSVSVVVFIAVVGGLLVILMAMTAAIFLAFKDRRQQHPTFDDASSRITAETTTLAKEMASQEELGPPPSMECYNELVCFPESHGGTSSSSSSILDAGENKMHAFVSQEDGRRGDKTEKYLYTLSWRKSQM